MNIAWIVIGVFLSLSTICDCHLILNDGFVGIGLDLSKLGLKRGRNAACPPSTNFTCECSSKRKPIPVAIPVCSRTQKPFWKVKCEPCDNLKPEDICPRYQLCEQCHLDGGDSCVTCPDGKFGTWCENTCSCQNGATCDRSGRCVCPREFEGRRCEKRKGCEPLPPIVPPLQVLQDPPDHPTTVLYSCPSNYVLSGKAAVACVSGKWSSGPPTCKAKCPILSAPANGRLVFSDSDLVEGISAEVNCLQGYRLVGQKTLTCLVGGRWSHELPLCEELAVCPDPGNVNNANRIELPSVVKIGGQFLQDSRIQYMCKAGFEHMGAKLIMCTFEGTWSRRLPTCIKVATVVPDCQTPGSDIVAEEGVSVRIMCPPECADDDFKLWGTSIYRLGSSVCQAAIHSGKITNSGGPVAVINNGNYSHFTGSDSNYIESQSYPDIDGSFRFDRLKPQALSRDTDECEKGLTKLENVCVYVSNLRRSYEDAKAVCTNLGLHLEMPSDIEERLKLASMVSNKVMWTDEKFQTLETENRSITGGSPVTRNSLCPAANLEGDDFKPDSKPCREVLSYACIRKADASKLATCRDPGPLINGNAVPIGRIGDAYYVGSAIEYSCQTLHYLKGEKSISCTGKGTWSASKPECIKVDACADPPVPIGGVVTYLAPLKSNTEQRSAIYNSRNPGFRAARLPAGLAAPLPQNMYASTTPGPIPVSLPPGLHRVGSRAMIDCESRYYKLIGSRTRRCQEMGEWSGRPPTCMPVCGRSDSPRSPFIVNGNATDIGQWPWQAGIARYLQDYKQWFLLCGASLLNEMWVITAAHCVTYAGTTLSIEPDKFQVYLGKYHRLDSKDDEYVQVRKIQEIHIHPDYDPGLFDADIALIQLDSPVQLNSRVQPVCLPTEQSTRENLVAGKKGVVTGWGMNENETYSETLQQAVLPVVTQSTCEKGYEDSELPLTVTDNMFCAGFAQGRSDACSGDSGGPMVFVDESSRERKWVLEGIVSWGSPRGCGNANQYGGFTTVSRFLDWIHLYF